MLHVYMDDQRPCPTGFTLARDGEETLRLLEQEQVDVLSLDHDMGWDRLNGTQVAQQMVLRGLFARRIYLHSSSGMGRMGMFQLLYGAKPEGVQVYSHPMPEEVLLEVSRANKRGERGEIQYD